MASELMTAVAPALDRSRKNGRHRSPQARSGAGRMTRFLRGVGGILLLGLVMEAVSRLELVNPAFLPPFSRILQTCVELLVTPSFLAALGATAAGWAAGLAVSILIAVPIGVLLGLSDWAFRFTRSFVEVIRPVPAVALIPLMIVVFGQGFEMKLAIAVYASIWPILFNTIYGVRGAAPQAKEMARSFGVGPAGIVGRIVMPSAAPFIATGIRIASSISLIVIITVEMLAGAGEGLGNFISQVRALGLDPALAYAGAVIAGVFGLLINSGLALMERRFFAWQQQGQDQ